ncbi:MAG: ABC transporter substrate-binding protein [Desulfovibrionaceae bacterium]|nr:ABC transporter substrate-binding protein [Desulfovibrionaceae bacterium]
MKRNLILSCAAAAFFGAGWASAQDLTVVNFGGANGNAQKAAFSEPFEKKTGHKIIPVEYNGEEAKIRAMVEARHVTWDLVEVETNTVIRGCDEGLYEKLDYSKIAPKSDFIAEAPQECGLGFFVYSMVLAYNGDKLKTAPASWKDFWDVKRFPGKRGMRKLAPTNLEFALMADGVPAKDVYQVLSTKAGVDRAFKKLDEIKPYIQWWEAGAQAPQFLVAGDVVMSTVFSGRVDAARREGKNLNVVWDGSIYDLDYWAIPKGSPNKDLVLEYIAFSTAAPQQAEYARHIAYGPVNQAAIRMLDAKTLADMPNSPANIKNAVLLSSQFWNDHGEELQQRFTAWAAK